MIRRRIRDLAWHSLVQDRGTFHGDGQFRIAAYSEYMPPPQVGLKPYGWLDPFTVPDSGDDGWRISEYQQAHELVPGITHIGSHLLPKLRKLADGQAPFGKWLLDDNPYWPPELARRAGHLPHEHCALVLPMALSRTQDDKGRVRWTLFGASHEGPSRAFWKSFHVGPDRKLPARAALALFRELLVQACGLSRAQVANLHRAGLRILPTGHDPEFPHWAEDELPAWTRTLVMGERAALGPVRYIFTFRPFAKLPPKIQRAYLAGKVRLLPFPGSLIFFGHPGYRKLAREMPGAIHLPLLHQFHAGHSAPSGMRIPQSGWLDEPRDGATVGASRHQGAIVSRAKRTHRWSRTHRDEDEFEFIPEEDPVAEVLFSTNPALLGLYGKPMARNAQVWTHDFRLLLDGPAASRARLDEAARALIAGGHFGYRFYFPPMRTGAHEVYWHRPLVGCFPAGAAAPTVVPDLLDGFLTASLPGSGARAQRDAVELWPRLEHRRAHQDAVDLFPGDPGHRAHTTTYNVRKLLEAAELHGRRLRRSYARALLTLPASTTLEAWVESLTERAADPRRGAQLVKTLRDALEPRTAALPVDKASGAPRSHTFATTARREFEERYWRTIATLAEGRFVNKNNADPAGAPHPPDPHRDLGPLGDYLHQYYREVIERHRMSGRALVGNHWFRWATDFDFPWMEGWSLNQTGRARERNIVVVIPGTDRSQAVVMADHYDTAYMEDVYDKGPPQRASAAGADDNHSATAALMLAAESLLPLSAAGKLRHDVWLVHLTGEEFPPDCLGARNLVERLVERNFAIHADGAGWVDLSKTQVRGAYILDMVAHNNDHNPYVFQISPGEGPQSARLAYRAHLANERWNQSVPLWNRAPQRAKAGPPVRVETGAHAPHVTKHPALRGEVRPGWHFASSLYNTDAQILSDAGVPVVLFMEAYDINRKGYHDTNDTMKNIDLDYGAALVAIAIESVAEAAIVEDL